MDLSAFLSNNQFLLTKGGSPPQCALLRYELDSRVRKRKLSFYRNTLVMNQRCSDGVYNRLDDFSCLWSTVFEVNGQSHEIFELEIRSCGKESLITFAIEEGSNFIFIASFHSLFFLIFLNFKFSAACFDVLRLHDLSKFILLNPNNTKTRSASKNRELLRFRH